MTTTRRTIRIDDDGMATNPAIQSQWRASHDWEFSPFVMDSYPPQYSATCRRCGQGRSGHTHRFKIQDCPGRVERQ